MFPPWLAILIPVSRFHILLTSLSQHSLSVGRIEGNSLAEDGEGLGRPLQGDHLLGTYPRSKYLLGRYLDPFLSPKSHPHES